MPCQDIGTLATRLRHELSGLPVMISIPTEADVEPLVSDLRAEGVSVVIGTSVMAGSVRVYAESDWVWAMRDFALITGGTGPDTRVLRVPGRKAQ